MKIRKVKKASMRPRPGMTETQLREAEKRLDKVVRDGNVTVAQANRLTEIRRDLKRVMVCVRCVINFEIDIKASSEADAECRFNKKSCKNLLTWMSKNTKNIGDIDFEITSISNPSE